MGCFEAFDFVLRSGLCLVKGSHQSAATLASVSFILFLALGLIASLALGLGAAAFLCLSNWTDWSSSACFVYLLLACLLQCRTSTIVRSSLRSNMAFSESKQAETLLCR